MLYYIGTNTKCILSCLTCLFLEKWLNYLRGWGLNPKSSSLPNTYDYNKLGIYITITIFYFLHSKF